MVFKRFALVIRFALVLLLAFAGLAGLSGCGPVYTTRYDFVPPPNESGGYCTAMCDRNQMDCRRYEDRKNDRCNQDVRYAKQEYEDCLNRNNRDLTKCSDRSFGMNCFSPNYSVCDDTYRRCYQNCGGTVLSRQECVFNCDAAQVQGQLPASAPSAVPPPAYPQQPGYPQPGYPQQPANSNDGCVEARQPCTCANTGWSGFCGPGPHKPGLYCRCEQSNRN